MWAVPAAGLTQLEPGAKLGSLTLGRKLDTKGLTLWDCTYLTRNARVGQAQRQGVHWRVPGVGQGEWGEMGDGGRLLTGYGFLFG